ncbi:MAG: hypothetical protein JWQ49_4571 [Edaphobacter sp.]|nr:hypothetical protein [Edaphobacter sp.]
MPIIIRDETANLLILTIDNSGNATFGDGTPINLLTVGGHGIIDSNGHVVHGLNSCSAHPTSGSVNVGINSSATITTISGRVPTVQVDTTQPAASYFMEFRTPGDPTSGGTESTTALPGRTVHNFTASAGSFAIFNQNIGDGYVNDPASPYHDPSLDNAPCVYRWL